MIVGWNNVACKSKHGIFLCHQRKQVLQDLLMPVDNRKAGAMKLHNNNNITEQLMPGDRRKVRRMKLHNNNKIAEELMPIDSKTLRPMKLHNNNNIIEELMPINSKKVRPMNLHNNNNIIEQLMPINNNREEIQIGHCLKLPYSAILIAQSHRRCGTLHIRCNGCCLSILWGYWI